MKLITGGMATAGVILLLTDGYLGDLQEGDSNAMFGVALALICAALAAMYSVLVKPFMAKHGALTVNDQFAGDRSLRACGCPWGLAGASGSIR